jgi:imidazolonepropionase-like amidohydrolase
MAGFTAERDMGTEGAGSADTAIRNAIDAGLIPGPRLRISGNAVDILGGHEDANHFNPDAHVPSNATYANSAASWSRSSASSSRKARTSSRSTRPAPTAL